MSIHVALHHRTTYTYDRLIALGPQTIRLRPAPHCRTKILSYSLKVEPSNQFLNWQQDSHSNYLARLVFPEKTGKLDIMVDLVAEMSVYNPFDFFLEPYAENFPFQYEPWLFRDLSPFLQTEPVAPAVQKYVEEWNAKEPMRMIDFLV
ncbi:MAG TPA: transglutaminase N-terminal domain-containing protein, partial [Verrucomicrobium sp.]|nr:transglutaminase N-terminal domain-containing protein [Verrucomicrobium sp.]